MNNIEQYKTKRKSYTVQFAFAGFDSHDDKTPAFDEPDIWIISVWATSTMESIVMAKQILDIERGAIATDWHSQHPHMRDNMTMEEINKVYENFLERNVFKSWMLIEPTSIQAHLTDDFEKLLDMTFDNVHTISEHIGEEAENYLKGSDDVT